MRAVGKQVGIKPLIIQGEELDKKGFGGMWVIGNNVTIHFNKVIGYANFSTVIIDFVHSFWLTIFTHSKHECIQALA